MKLNSRACFFGHVLLLFSTLAMAAESSEDSIGTFEIGRFEVVGDTLLGAEPIAQLLSRYTGKERHFSDVQQAMESLEGAYRERGFNLVQVRLPEQELNQGAVRLVVKETRIGQVKVAGNSVFDETNIRQSVPELREGEAPNFTRISSALRLANENPAKKTALSLQNDGRDGEVNATLQVLDEKPWTAGVMLDNAGSENTGKTQMTVQYQHFNVANLDHRLSLQFTTTLEQPSRVGVYGAAYHIPLYARGDSLDFYGSYSDVDSGTVSAGAFNLQVSGKGSVLGGRYNHNLARQGNCESKLAIGLEQKAFQNNLGFQGVELGHDVTVRPLSLIYSGDLTQAKGKTSFYLMGARNVPGGDHANESDFSRIRQGASSTYSLLRYGISHLHILASDWQLRAILNGQMTQDSLVPGEQFGAGGATSVRGFGERVVSDDQGIMANLELYTPDLCANNETSAMQCRLLAFYDAGSVTRNNPLPGERTATSIASAGIGFRMALGKTLTVQMDMGQVLVDGDLQSKGDRRVHLKINLAY